MPAPLDPFRQTPEANLKIITAHKNPIHEA
jgi:hypothetical protein